MQNRIRVIHIAQAAGGVEQYIRMLLKYMDSTEFENMWNICGAYCVPEYRGTGAMCGLLEHVKAALKAENIPLLGVDCESINHAANRFWQKFFTPYTCSVTRRVEI